MQIPVLIEQIQGNGYRASGGEPLKLSAEGATREEALQKLQSLIRQRLAQGAEVVQLTVDNARHPWDEFVGTWDENDPVIQEWEKAVVEYRRQVDADPDIP
jgi:hypothetical protein